MIVKYCSKCNGRPYTTNMDICNCPKCGSSLGIESVDEIDIEDRSQIILPEIPEKQENTDVTPEYDFEKNMDKNTDIDKAPFRKTATKNFNQPVKSQFTGASYQQEKFSPDNCIRGRVLQYSSTGREDGSYRRLLPVKLYQAIVYSQRLEDVLHRFVVRIEQGGNGLGYEQYTDIPVNVHGTISGGLQITDNAEVEVRGKYCKGVLMADKVNIINNGYKSRVGFQRSIKAITYSILLIIMVAFICFAAASSNGYFLDSLKEFCIVWAVITGILAALYLVMSLTKIGILTRMFSDKKRSFPLMGILLVALALAFLFVNAFGSFAGFGSYLSSWIYALIPIIIFVAAVVFLLKKIIFG